MINDALTFAWEKFKSNPAPWVSLLLIVFVAELVVSVPDLASPQTTFSAVNILALVGDFVIGAATKIVLARGALLILDGRKLEFRDFFTIDNWGQVLVTAFVTELLVGIPAYAVEIGTSLASVSLPTQAVLLLIATVISAAATYFTFFAVVYTLDQRQRADAAIKSSAALTTRHAAILFPLAAVNMGLLMVGAFALLVGLLVAVPVAWIGATYAYRNLVQGPVTPLVPDKPPVGAYFPPGVPPGGGFTEPPHEPGTWTPPPSGGFTEPPFPD